MPTWFEVTFSGSFRLAIDEVWPNGDAPEKPTPADVVRKMMKEGSKTRLLDDWNLGDDLTIIVSGAHGMPQEW